VTLFIVRHALAEDKEKFAKKNKNDEKRPLTSRGKKQFKKTSKQYYKKYPDMDVFYSSPLVRAVETAEILKKKYKKKYQILDLLKPEGDPAKLLQFLLKQKKENIFIVGHEPSLSEFVGYCVAGKAESVIELKKGGLCVLKQKDKNFQISQLV
jgi:phosphohistidine phosphatase